MADNIEKRELRHKRRKRSKILSIILMVLIILVSIILAGVVSYFASKKIGEFSLRDTEELDTVAVQEMSEKIIESSDEEELANIQELKPGQVAYDGKIYEYNEDLLTFLVMGIDNKKSILRDDKTPGAAGQADTIILVTLDEKDKQIRLVTVSRDSMVPVKIFDEYGIFVEEKTEQITLQYAYGNGQEMSCELMKEAVSDLFYGIPIHGYCTFGYNSVAEINDAIGGVEVTVPEDLTRYNSAFEKGATVRLEGDTVYDYIQRRDWKSDELNTNGARMKRQSQYVTAFIDQAKQAIAKDVTLLLSIYNAVADDLVTSIDLDQINYLSTIVLESSFSSDQIYSVAGTVVAGEEHDECYVDDQALYELILEVFYREVE